VRTVEEGWEVVRAKRADVLVLKPMAIGGLRATRALACAAIDAGLGVVVTSSFDTAVGVAGALHLAASLPGPMFAHDCWRGCCFLLRQVSQVDAPVAGTASNSTE
jgi:L-alanine-DL-glutamate epimerase-like enolase superfamily enzyme